MYGFYIVMIIVINLQELVQCESPVDYYDELITYNIKNSYKYKCPHDNSKFYSNSNKNVDNITDNQEFDFIIIGSGTSGSIIASRLSEAKKWKILLLEAGKFEDDFSDIPFTDYYNFNSDRNWCYKAQKYEDKSEKLPYFRGKSIGGSSTINDMVYTRGNREDYDNWAIENPGWSYDEVLPFFEKFEKSYIPNDNFLGKTGPIPITYSSPTNITAIKFYENLFNSGAKELNIHQIINYNGTNQLGISKTQHCKFLGKRVSTGRAYIDKNLNNTFLKIITESLATNILIDQNKKAYGVRFVKNGKAYTALTKKEVILSAGAVNSPQILMLAGIGPQGHLRQFNITTVINLPVGKNVIDHCTLGLPIRTKFHETVKLNRRKEIRNFLQGKGVLTQDPLTNNDVIFFHNFNSSLTRPEVEFLVTIPILFLLTPHERSRLLNFKNVLMVAALLHPKSRGEITLTSPDARDFPKINLRMFSNPEDVSTIYKYIKFIEKIIDTSEFRKNRVRKLHVPTKCDVLIFDEKRYTECFIKEMSVPFMHMVGSNRMGANPEFSVVDNELKVHGIRDLRVADASVIPVSISGHTASACMMVGEKAADLIISTYNI